MHKKSIRTWYIIKVSFNHPCPLLRGIVFHGDDFFDQGKDCVTIGCQIFLRQNSWCVIDISCKCSVMNTLQQRYNLTEPLVFHRLFTAKIQKFTLWSMLKLFSWRLFIARKSTSTALATGIAGRVGAMLTATATALKWGMASKRDDGYYIFVCKHIFWVHFRGNGNYIMVQKRYTSQTWFKTFILSHKPGVSHRETIAVGDIRETTVTAWKIQILKMYCLRFYLSELNEHRLRMGPGARAWGIDSAGVGRRGASGLRHRRTGAPLHAEARGGNLFDWRCAMLLRRLNVRADGVLGRIWTLLGGIYLNSEWTGMEVGIVEPADTC